MLVGNGLEGTALLGGIALAMSIATGMAACGPRGAVPIKQGQSAPAVATTSSAASAPTATLQEVCGEAGGGQSALSHIHIAASMTLTGGTSRLGQGCELDLAAGVSLTVDHVNATTQSLAIVDDGHPGAVGPSVAIRDSTLSGATGAALRVAVDGPAASVTVVGSSLSYPAEIGLAASSSLQVISSTVTSQGSRTQGITAVSKLNADFENDSFVTNDPSDHGRALLLAPHCTIVSLRGALTECTTVSSPSPVP